MRIYPVEVASQKRGYKSKLIECSCGFGETFLKIDYESIFNGKLEEDEQPCWYVSICVQNKTFWHKLRTAWKYLRGYTAEFYSISIDAQDIKELRDMADYWFSRIEPELRKELAKETNNE